MRAYHPIEGVKPLERLMVRAIFFDVDGTLADSDNTYVERVANLLTPLGIAEGKAMRLGRRVVRLMEGPVNFLLTLADRLHFDGFLARLLDMRSAARVNDANRMNSYPMVPAVRPMLALLGQRYKLAIVSTRNAHTVETFLSEHHLREFFGVVVSSQTCQFTKPFPEPLLYAAKALGEKIGHCLMVGDTVVDMRAARAAGAQSLGVLCGFGTERQLRAAGAQMILASSSEVGTYLTSGPLAAEGAD